MTPQTKSNLGILPRPVSNNRFIRSARARVFRSVFIHISIALLSVILIVVSLYRIAHVHVDPAPTIPDVRAFSQSLDRYVGKEKPWSRSELEELRAVVSNLIEE